jgi:hypothetical protein
MTGKAVEILLAIVLALIPIVTPFVLRWLNAKVGAERMGQLKQLVRDAVQAAEMLGASSGWTGEAKKQWVIDEVSALTKTDPATIALFVEKAVYGLKEAYTTELVTGADGKAQVKCDTPCES